MQYHSNSNLIQSIENRISTPQIGLVTRNLWCWLEGGIGGTYDSGSGVWRDNWVWGNDASVTGSAASISINTGSFGGYYVNFKSTNGFNPSSYLSWGANRYSSPNGPVPTDTGGECIFIQMELRNADELRPMAMFNTTTNQLGLEYNASWWGGNEGSGDVAGYLGWPNASNFTSAKPSPVNDDNAIWINPVGDESLAYQVWNSGPGYNIAGTKVGVNGPSVNIPNYVKDNNDIQYAFDFSNYELRFGHPYELPYPFNGADGTNHAYGFV
jgi:hypothetical protein